MWLFEKLKMHNAKKSIKRNKEFADAIKTINENISPTAKYKKNAIIYDFNVGNMWFDQLSGTIDKFKNPQDLFRVQRIYGASFCVLYSEQEQPFDIYTFISVCSRYGVQFTIKKIDTLPNVNRCIYMYATYYQMMSIVDIYEINKEREEYYSNEVIRHMIELVNSSDESFYKESQKSNTDLWTFISSSPNIEAELLDEKTLKYIKNNDYNVIIAQLEFAMMTDEVIADCIAWIPLNDGKMLTLCFDTDIIKNASEIVDSFIPNESEDFFKYHESEEDADDLKRVKAKLKLSSYEEEASDEDIELYNSVVNKESDSVAGM